MFLCKHHLESKFESDKQNKIDNVFSFNFPNFILKFLKDTIILHCFGFSIRSFGQYR